MSDHITFRERVDGLTAVWESRAGDIEQFDEANPAAKALRQCARDAREVLDAEAPTWVTHAQVRLRTGRSESYLYQRYAELADDGRARKRRGRWEVTYAAALEIPMRASYDSSEQARDPDEWAELTMDRIRRRAS